MKEYLKMSDVFVGEYKPKRRVEAWPPSRHGETMVELYGKPAEYGAHAINSHDELVAEVGLLSASLNHANSNHELFERQYYLEKDRVDGLQVEVERLKKAVELASMTMNEVDRVLTERIKNGAYDLDDISAEVEGAIKRLSETE